VFGVLVVLGERLPARLIPAISAFANQTAIALLNARLMSSLQESERRYRGIFEAANDGLLVFDAGTHRIAEANAAACTMYGYPYEKMLGLGLHRLATPERHHHLAEMIRDIECHGYHACQSQHVRHNGDEFPVEIEGMRLTYRGHPHLLVVVTDITERIEAQQTMVNAERLRALGQMAGGIAHDFNNILVSIRGYADMARLDMHEHPDALTTDLDQIIVGADDAAEAVRRLQSLYRQTDDTSDFVPIQLDDIVTQATSLTRPRWKDQCQAQGITIQIHTELLAPPVVLGNPSELRRLLTNLLVNAIDAMPGGGDITIATGSDEHGSYMLMRDAGIGIPPEQLARIFDPFFSTKKSSGLGLTVSKNIVERHGGNIEVTSLPGRGTTFTVHLPISAVAAVAPALPEPIEGTPSDRPRLSVLVVDDEAAVRQLLTRFIEREGHEVTTVASGREALQRLDERVYDLLITDLGMPDMSGHEVTHHAHERSPHMPTVLITGWGETITPEQLAKMNVLALLPKPFSHKDLGALLRHVHSGKPLH
jgi:PAS domain S-box-containing protein